MRLKASEWTFPLCLAPMAGYTDLPFRLLCREQGADIVTTEMISAKGLVYGAAATRALLSSAPEEQPLIVQLFGREPEIVAAAARIAEETLGDALLALDINMGCPAPKITGNGEGSALMREPALAGRIVEAAARAVSVPVTVKCRSGWDAGSVNAPEFARRMEESGAAMLTLHARTRERFYAGEADWALISRVRARIRIPLIVNGDVRSGRDALAMREQTGCDGVSV
ncbi:MAG: tRNA-dihydrouridine synthase family protein [Clostridia bacterium]|nr:tRNA-dihydrouridine synthase family protein [Clostridia bacterium]